MRIRPNRSTQVPTPGGTGATPGVNPGNNPVLPPTTGGNTRPALQSPDLTPGVVNRNRGFRMPRPDLAGQIPGPRVFNFGNPFSDLFRLFRNTLRGYLD